MTMGQGGEHRDAPYLQAKQRMGGHTSVLPKRGERHCLMDQSHGEW